MVYEFPDRGALEEFFRTEPYCTSGIYERVDVFDWRRGVAAGQDGRRNDAGTSGRIGA
jgi:hypothetical protein